MADASGHDFDKDYWERHWAQRHGMSEHARRHGADEPAPHPYLARETADLTPGTALDAGCGTGTEALWLAARGWHVTGVDIAAGALDLAAGRSAGLTGMRWVGEGSTGSTWGVEADSTRSTREVEADSTGSVQWIEADLTTWEPGCRFDLVTSAYAHPAMPQLDFYRRLANWVAPGGTLLIVGHLRDATGSGRHHHPEEASVALADITASVAPLRIETAEEHTRAVPGPGGGEHLLHDAVVRATRPRDSHLSRLPPLPKPPSLHAASGKPQRPERKP